MLAFLAAGCGQVEQRTPEETGASDSEPSTTKETTVEETTVGEAAASGETVDIQILGFNDLEGNLEPYENDDGEEVGGVAYLDAIMDQREEENPEGTIRVHVGDLVGASPLISAYYHDEPTIEAANLMELDLGTLGNHEFDEGAGEMFRLIDGGQREGARETSDPDFEGADFPYVSANVVDRDSGEPVIEPYEVLEVNGVEVGFIGLVTTSTPEKVVPDAVEPFEFRDLSDSVNMYADELRGQGVETIVVLAHSGNENEDVEPPMGEIVDEAPQMSEAVDVIIAGDTPFPMNYEESGKLVVQGSGTGSDLVAAQMEVDAESGDVVESSGEVVDVVSSEVEPSEDLRDLVEEQASEVAEVSNRVVGEAAEDIAADYEAESALGNLIADAQRTYTDADIAFMNPGGIRADINQGEVTYGDLFTVQPFGNGMVRQEMTGEQVKAILEQQGDEEVSTLLQVSGIQHTYDAEAPEGERATEITVGGEDLDPNSTYTVAINSFLATGGDGFTLFTEGENPETLGSDLDALVEYIEGLEQPFTAPDPEEDQRITLEG
ncbi:MAG: bifunctional metallophosphatase/5'-nucleotidase [Rubrobacteraceae bacterium]